MEAEEKAKRRHERYYAHWNGWQLEEYFWHGWWVHEYTTPAGSKDIKYAMFKKPRELLKELIKVVQKYEELTNGKAKSIRSN